MKSLLLCSGCYQAIPAGTFATLNVIEESAEQKPAKAEIIGGPFCVSCTTSIAGFIMKLQSINAPPKGDLS